VAVQEANGVGQALPQVTRKTVKHPPKISAWGNFRWRGRAALKFLNMGDVMNGVRYRTILDETLELFMRQHGKTSSSRMVLCKSKIVSVWFKERLNITLIDWPDNSPDPSPIETV
jgi:hypothetical protein